MTPPAHPAGRSGWSRWTVWGAGLIVALGAGVATAHGLYEVALAAGFCDQAHLQRCFKKFVAATPGQYRANMHRAG